MEVFATTMAKSGIKQRDGDAWAILCVSSTKNTALSWELWDLGSNIGQLVHQYVFEGNPEGLQFHGETAHGFIKMCLDTQNLIHRTTIGT